MNSVLGAGSIDSSDRKTIERMDLECFSQNFSRDTDLSPLGLVPCLQLSDRLHFVFHYQKIESILILGPIIAGHHVVSIKIASHRSLAPVGRQSVVLDVPVAP